MKALLLGLTVVTCIVAAESEPVDAPFLKLIKELDELRMTANNYLEHHEQGSSPLVCASCNESSVALCNANEQQVPCGGGLDRCLTVTYINSVTSETTVKKNCFLSIFCAGVCATVNSSNAGNIQSCDSECCNTSLCNSGNPLPTTPAPVTSSTRATSSPTTVTTPTPATSSPTTVTTPTPATSSSTIVTTPPPTTSSSTTVTTPSPTPSSSTTVTTPTPVVCGGVFAQSGSIASPGFPGDYPNGVTCVWTTATALAVGRSFVLRFTALAFRDSGDSLEIFLGPVSIRRFTGFGKRKRSLYDEPSYERVYREDEGDYYDDNDNKDYYFYDGRRKKEHYIYHRRKRQTFFTVTLNGNNQVVRVVFQSNASGSASGFRALFAEEANGGGGGGGGGSSGESGGGSSDEEM